MVMPRDEVSSVGSPRFRVAGTVVAPARRHARGSEQGCARRAAAESGDARSVVIGHGSDRRVGKSMSLGQGADHLLRRAVLADESRNRHGLIESLLTARIDEHELSYV